MSRSKDTEKYTAKDYFGAMGIVILFILSIFVIVTVIERYASTDEPTCADYEKYHLEGSDFCNDDFYRY